MAKQKSKTHLFSWLLIVFVPLAVWWFFHIPPTGDGGLLLALVASLMPIAWDKSHPYLKSAWIATLFIVFFVEYRAIDKDRQEFAEKQRQARKDESDSFGKLLTQEQINLRLILDQEAHSLKDILESERTNFKNTLAQNRKAQNQERSDFAELLGKQGEFFKDQQELYEFATGQMLPANDPTPSTCSPVSGDDFIVQMADSAFSVNVLPIIVLKVSGATVIRLDKSENGSLMLSLDLRKQDGTVIGKLDKNGWITNPNSGLLITRDKHSIHLLDRFGKEFLTARFLNKHAFSISGLVPYQGQIIPLPMPFLRGCSTVHGVSGGSVITIVDLN